jgi:NADH-quinone oxidoreductase subunit J
MIVQMLVFYVLSAVAVAAGVMVISARNPVHSVLFLILAFFNAAGLFVLIGAELLAMVLVIVYVGAVAVLFMFVVMMLDINFIRLREGALQYLPVGGLVGLFLLVELVLVAGTRPLSPRSRPWWPTPRPRLRSPLSRRWGTCSTPATSTCSRRWASSCWWRW